MNGPDPGNKHPMKGFPQVCFIKNTVKNPNIIRCPALYRRRGQIRQRFTPDIIVKLLAIAWWEWPAEKISVNLKKIVSADIDALESCDAV